MGTSPERSLWLKSRAWIWEHWRTSDGKPPLMELLERLIDRMVKGQYFQKKVKDK